MRVCAELQAAEQDVVEAELEAAVRARRAEADRIRRAQEKV